MEKVKELEGFEKERKIVSENKDLFKEQLLGVIEKEYKYNRIGIKNINNQKIVPIFKMDKVDDSFKNDKFLYNKLSEYILLSQDDDFLSISISPGIIDDLMLINGKKENLNNDLIKKISFALLNFSNYYLFKKEDGLFVGDGVSKEVILKISEKILRGDKEIEGKSFKISKRVKEYQVKDIGEISELFQLNPYFINDFVLLSNSKIPKLISENIDLEFYKLFKKNLKKIVDNLFIVYITFNKKIKEKEKSFGNNVIERERYLSLIKKGFKYEKLDDIFYGNKNQESLINLIESWLSIFGSIDTQQKYKIFLTKSLAFLIKRKDYYINNNKEGIDYQKGEVLFSLNLDHRYLVDKNGSLKENNIRLLEMLKNIQFFLGEIKIDENNNDYFELIREDNKISLIFKRDSKLKVEVESNYKKSSSYKFIFSSKKEKGKDNFSLIVLDKIPDNDSKNKLPIFEKIKEEVELEGLLNPDVINDKKLNNPIFFRENVISIYDSFNTSGLFLNGKFNHLQTLSTSQILKNYKKILFNRIEIGDVSGNGKMLIAGSTNFIEQQIIKGKSLGENLLKLDIDKEIVSLTDIFKKKQLSSFLIGNKISTLMELKEKGIDSYMETIIEGLLLKNNLKLKQTKADIIKKITSNIKSGERSFVKDFENINEIMEFLNNIVYNYDGKNLESIKEEIKSLNGNFRLKGNNISFLEYIINMGKGDRFKFFNQLFNIPKDQSITHSSFFREIDYPFLLNSFIDYYGEKTTLTLIKSFGLEQKKEERLKKSINTYFNQFCKHSFADFILEKKRKELENVNKFIEIESFYLKINSNIDNNLYLKVLGLDLIFRKDNGNINSDIELSELGIGKYSFLSEKEYDVLKLPQGKGIMISFDGKKLLIKYEFKLNDEINKLIKKEVSNLFNEFGLNIKEQKQSKKIIDSLEKYEIQLRENIMRKIKTINDLENFSKNRYSIISKEEFFESINIFLNKNIDLFNFKTKTLFKLMKLFK